MFFKTLLIPTSIKLPAGIASHIFGSIDPELSSSSGDTPACWRRRSFLTLLLTKSRANSQSRSSHQASLRCSYSLINPAQSPLDLFNSRSKVYKRAWTASSDHLCWCLCPDLRRTPPGGCRGLGTPRLAWFRRSCRPCGSICWCGLRAWTCWRLRAGSWELVETDPNQCRWLREHDDRSLDGSGSFFFQHCRAQLR